MGKECVVPGSSVADPMCISCALSADGGSVVHDLWQRSFAG